jgi:glycosyltransferase involved in cell wall biosynthesis
MRVLVIHNRYRAPGGEERAVAEQVAMLRRHGHTVALLERTSDGLGRARAGAALLAGGLDSERVAAAVRALGAEVVHAHNLHPLLGWRALAAARAAGARTVLQLHNFRLFCAIGVAFRAGEPCFACRAGWMLPGLVHRCRGSFPEAATYAVGLARQRPRLLAAADRFVALSHAHGVQLQRLGLPAGRVEVVCNFLPSSAFACDSAAQAGRFALCSGRLVAEKGFDTAIGAAARAGVPLVIAGSGPDEARLRALARGASVRFSGWVDQRELARLRRQAAVVLVPSRCWEACPYALLEACAAGVPVLVSNRGSLPELAPPGAVVAADDARTWAQALGALWREPERRREQGRRALAHARERFGEERHHAALMGAYRAALAA